MSGERSHSGKAEEGVFVGVRGGSSFEKISEEVCSNPAEIGRVFAPR